MYTSGGCCTELGKTLAIWITTCGAIASTAGVDLSIPPVAPADVPAIFYPIIRISTCGATKTITCGAETRLPSGGCIPPVALAELPAIPTHAQQSEVNK